MVLETSYNGRNIAIAGQSLTRILAHLETQIRSIIDETLTGEDKEDEIDRLDDEEVTNFLVTSGNNLTIRA